MKTQTHFMLKYPIAYFVLTVNVCKEIVLSR